MITLDTRFANRIIEKVKQYTDFNINIMNERGIIVASLMKERIGTFHEIAMKIIQSDQDEIVVEKGENYIGTREGINIAFGYKGKKLGVIGITGDPSQVRPVALILRMSIEIMLEYEIYKEERFQRKSLKDQFLNRIMYGESVTAEELEEYSKRLSLEEKFIRIPVILRLNQSAEFTESVLADIREYHYLSRQDISSITRNNDMIIFKYFEENLMEVLREYKFCLAEKISAVLRYLKSKNIPYTIYVGSFQNQFVNYQISYNHCKWLRNYCMTEGRSYYFYDYLNEYVHSFVPFSEMKGIYEVFRQEMGEREAETFVSVIGALAKTGYNLSEASRVIHVHKNTLVYRLDKLRDEFGMNPIQEISDREFMTNLSEYIMKAVGGY